MKTMIIENDVDRALFYESCGVDRIFVDLEIKGKRERQGHLDTVISNHSLEDLKNLNEKINFAKIITRINPLNEDSEAEINEVLEIGTDIIMLPMFKTADEVKKFIKFVSGRAKVSILLETAPAIVRIDSILNLRGIDEVHIGLNDLHLDLGVNFMFELFSSGLIDFIVNKLSSKKISYGIGGVATSSGGIINGSDVIKEYARLGSRFVILSRSFKNLSNHKNFKMELDLILREYKNYDNLSSKIKVQCQRDFYNLINMVQKGEA
jgi:2-keto-3-deoxy-L-rhamnonate aldolase RhmA